MSVLFPPYCKNKSVHWKKNGNKYFALTPSNKKRDTYNERCMKINFSLDDCFSPEKSLETCNVIIVARPAFHEGNIYYSQVQDECFYVVFTLLVG